MLIILAALEKILSGEREREWSVCDRRTCLIVIGDRTRLIERRLFSRVADWFSHNHSCLSTGEGYQSSVGGDADSALLLRLMLVISREKEVVKSEVRRGGGGVTLASSSLLREALARYPYYMPVCCDM